MKQVASVSPRYARSPQGRLDRSIEVTGARTRSSRASLSGLARKALLCGSLLGGFVLGSGGLCGGGLCGGGLCGGGLCGGEAAEAASDLDRLLDLNSQALFGSDASVKEGKVTLRFLGKGQFEEGFATRGSRGLGFLSDDGQIKDAATRKVLLEGAEGQFAFVGRQAGIAMSKFSLADEWVVRFRLRIPSFPASGQLNMMFNRQDSKSYIQSMFFREVFVVEGSRKQRKVSSNSTYAAPTASWFDRKSPGVPFEISFKNGKFSIEMTVGEKGGAEGKGGEGAKKEGKEASSKVELVAWEDIKSPSRGRIVFEFRNMSFLVTDLVIEGKYDSEWAEEEIAKLKQQGTLKLEQPKAEEPKAEEPKEGSAPAGASAADLGIPVVPPKRSLGDTDISKPDSEADDEL